VYSVSNLNVTGRKQSGSELIALDIDAPSSSSSTPFNLRSIIPLGTYGALGNAILDTVGFTGEIISPSTIHFYIPNLPPYMGSYFDAATLGANASIEVFSHERGTTEMQHLRTIQSPAIWSPNRPASLGGGSFLVTNDHGAKLGWRKHLELFIGGGTVAYCSYTGECHTATSAPEYPNFTKNLKFPNGLARAEDGLIYVPSTADGTVKVFTLQPNQTMHLLHTIPVGMPLDNVSPDAKGDLWVPGFPDVRQLLKSTSDPYEHVSPSTIFRIRKVASKGKEGGLAYEVEKMLEDKEGKVISGATTVVHDAKSGRLFIGAAVSPYLVVCEPR
jgi:hypothetical protein